MNPFVRFAFLATAMSALAAANVPAGADEMSMPMAMPMAHAVQKTQNAGPFRVMLVVLPAEPFVTAAQVAQTHATSGMLVVGGAEPVQPGAASHPNHHLVVHIYDPATGKAVRGAQIAMTYAPVSDGVVGTPVAVPIVEMEAVGGGAESTHYGNNVTLAPGTYHVTVRVGANASTTFTVQIA